MRVRTHPSQSVVTAEQVLTLFLFFYVPNTTLEPPDSPSPYSDLTEWSQGKLLEALCIGMAEIVAAVNKIAFDGKVITLPGHESGLGPVGMALWEKILAIQESRDEYQGWSVIISE